MAPPDRPNPFIDSEEESTKVSNSGVKRVPRGSTPAKLELRSGPGSPRTFVLELDETFIGRSEGSDVQVDSGEISRRHARLTLHDGVAEIEDLNSRNGVLVNEVKVLIARLSEGDVVQLGDSVFIFHEGYE